MEFTPITTQEQFDSMIADRIRRATESAKKEFAGWLSPDEHGKKLKELQEKLTKADETVKTHEATITDLNGKIKKYETDAVKVRVAAKYGLPAEVFDRLRGETEEEIAKDAESFARFITPTAPLANPDPAGDGGKSNAELMTMLAGMEIT